MEESMRVIECHMVDGDLVKRIEHDLTESELKAKQAEPVPDGVIISFVILEGAKPTPVTAREPSKAETVIEAVAKKIRKTTTKK